MRRRSAVDQVPERPLEGEPPKSQAEEAIDSYTMRTYSPPAGWILNDVTYMYMWMLVTGRKREVFDVSSFVQQHRDILPELKQVRNVVSVLILPSRCPVTKALNDLERHERGKNPPPEEPEIPSQSYWTTLKSWRPW